MGIMRILFLAGHIHRSQVLAKDLQARELPAPVFYPGSIERTSFSEKNEKKGYLIFEFESGTPKKAILRRWQFHQLPSRPMSQFDLHPSKMKQAQLQSWIEDRLAALPEDSIVKYQTTPK